MKVASIWVVSSSSEDRLTTVAWRIPAAQEEGRLWGLQRVSHLRKAESMNSKQKALPISSHCKPAGEHLEK